MITPSVKIAVVMSRLSQKCSFILYSCNTLLECGAQCEYEMIGEPVITL